MSKVEFVMFVSFVFALVAGAHYLGKIEGRIAALEDSRDYSSIKEERDTAIALIKQSASDSMEEMRTQLESNLDNFSDIQARLESMETFVQRDRPPLDEPVNTPGESPWGLWKGPAYCPEKHYVCGLEQKVEATQGKGDDTATNSVRMYCCPL